MANSIGPLDSMEIKNPSGKSLMAVGSAPSTPLDVLVRDQDTPVVAAYLVREVSATTLAADFILDTATATLATGHGFIVGDVLVIQGYYQGKIISVVGDIVTLSQRANLTFPSGTAVRRTQSGMNVNGSVTPVIFGLESVSGRKFDLYQLKVAFRGTSDMDDAKFASLPALAKGVIFRARINPTRYNNYFTARDNTEFHLRGVLTYNAKAPSGSYGAIFTFNLRDIHGVALRLNQDVSERIEVIIQDDLTGLTYMAATVQGHVVED